MRNKVMTLNRTSPCPFSMALSDTSLLAVGSLVRGLCGYLPWVLWYADYVVTFNRC